MNSNSIFRPLVTFLLCGQIFLYLFSWESAYSDDAVGALLFHGADAALPQSALVAAGDILFALYVLAYIGTLVFARWSRCLLAALTLLGGLWIPFNGVAISSGIEAMIGYYLTVGDGVIVALSFFSAVRKRFARS